MAKKKKKAAKLRTKGADRYGVVFIDQINPAISIENSKSIDIDLTIDEGLKLHLALWQALSDLNRLDRRSSKARARGVRFSLYPEQRRMMVEQGSVVDNSAPR
jgi:hypothetical protein